VGNGVGPDPEPGRWESSAMVAASASVMVARKLARVPTAFYEYSLAPHLATFR